MKQIAYFGTIAEARVAGYKEGRTQYDRGYLSRKMEITNDTPVYISGDGWLFYRKPCNHSTQYIIRQYFYPKYK